MQDHYLTRLNLTFQFFGPTVRKVFKMLFAQHPNGNPAPALKGFDSFGLARLALRPAILGWIYGITERSQLLAIILAHFFELVPGNEALNRAAPEFFRHTLRPQAFFVKLQ